MGWIGKDERYTELCLGHILQKGYLEDREGDAMITCNWILGKQVVKMVNGCITSGCSLGKWVVKMANGCITSECSLV
jgi:hypothetical protein